MTRSRKTDKINKMNEKEEENGWIQEKMVLSELRFLFYKKTMIVKYKAAETNMFILLSTKHDEAKVADHGHGTLVIILGNSQILSLLFLVLVCFFQFFRL